MIIYNIRANGPYEYDKFILNFGQLHNRVADAEQVYRDNDIVQGNVYIRDAVTLSEEINRITAPDGLLNRIALIREVITE